MVVVRSARGNNEEKVPSLGKKSQREVGRGRTGKGPNVDIVGVEANGEGLAIPSSSQIDRYRYGVGDKDNGRGVRGRPYTFTRSTKDNILKKSPFPRGEPAYNRAKT